MKLINDCNFKVSLTSLQILQKLIRMKQFGTQQMHNLICTKLIEKLGDSKLAIRQTVNTIIVEHFTVTTSFPLPHSFTHAHTLSTSHCLFPALCIA